MHKDFDKWNEKKKIIDERQADFLFNAGEVWWCTIGLNVGEESCGKGDRFRRPVLILKKLSRKSFIGIPLSTQKKEGTWFTPVLVNQIDQYLLLYQIRMFSANRLQRRLATLTSKEFYQIKEKLEFLLELSHNHQSDDSGSVGNPKSI